VSQENVEIVRRSWEVFLDGASRDDLGAVFDEERFAPTASVFPPVEVVFSRRYVGRAGFVEWQRSWAESFDELRISPEQIVDAGPDRVLVVVHQTATGRGSGAAVEERFGMVYVLENAQVTSLHVYRDPADALKAVGLEE